MLLYSKFSWVFKGKDHPRCEGVDRTSHYVWKPSDIKMVEDSDITKAVTAPPKPKKLKTAPPAPPKPTSFLSPKPDRHKQDRGMPLWHVSSNWAEGPHIKTPQGWLPYDAFLHHDMRSKKWEADDQKFHDISDKLKQFKMQAAPNPDYADPEDTDAGKRYEEWANKVEAYLKANRDLLEHYGADVDDVISALDYESYRGMDSEDDDEPGPPPSPKDAESAIGRLRDTVNEIHTFKGVPGRIVNIDKEDYRQFEGGWDTSFYTKKKGGEQAKSFNEDEYNAVEMYGGGTGRGNIAESVNLTLRESGGDPYTWDSKDEKHVARNLDTAIRKSHTEENLIAFRGLSISGLMESLGIDKVEDLVGKVIEDDGFVSTSLDRGIASRFAEKSGGAALISLKIPKGSNALFADPVKVKYTHEAEMILPRGSRFEIEEVDPAPSGRSSHRIIAKYVGVSHKREQQRAESKGQMTLPESSD